MQNHAIAPVVEKLLLLKPLLMLLVLWLQDAI